MYTPGHHHRVHSTNHRTITIVCITASCGRHKLLACTSFSPHGPVVHHAAGYNHNANHSAHHAHHPQCAGNEWIVLYGAYCGGYLLVRCSGARFNQELSCQALSKKSALCRKFCTRVVTLVSAAPSVHSALADAGCALYSCCC